MEKPTMSKCTPRVGGGWRDNDWFIECVLCGRLEFYEDIKTAEKKFAKGECQYEKQQRAARVIKATPTMYEGLQEIFKLANDSKSNPHELLAKISQIAEEAINKAEVEE